MNSVLLPGGPHSLALLDGCRCRLYRSNQRERAALLMKNGLYSVHIHILDGVRGRDSGILVLRNGVLIGGGPYFWSTGSYIVGNGTWKGHLRTNQHTSFATALFARSSPDRKLPAGFLGLSTTTGPRCLAPLW
jgi:hypothetical protein